VGVLYGGVETVCSAPQKTVDGFLLEALGGGITRTTDVSWSSSSLPPGLQITSINVTSQYCFGTVWYIDGTPTTAGSFTFSVTASESTYSGTATYTITIAASQASAVPSRKSPAEGETKFAGEANANQ
jgi:hypothetical protein